MKRKTTPIPATTAEDTLNFLNQIAAAHDDAREPQYESDDVAERMQQAREICLRVFKLTEMDLKAVAGVCLAAEKNQGEVTPSENVVLDVARFYGTSGIDPEDVEMLLERFRKEFQYSRRLREALDWNLQREKIRAERRHQQEASDSEAA